jgi:sugar/nucleoside kinase (ribokinase family)
VSEAIVAGHVSLDLFPRLYAPVQLEPGRLVSVGPASFSTGGVVSNTGLALHRLGVPVRLIGKVGDDLFGEAVRRALDEHGLAQHIVVAPGQATSYTIVINPPGLDRSFLHCAGANETFGAEDLPRERLAGARLLHFGYPPLLPRIYAERGAELREIFSGARDEGLATSLDMCALDPETEAGRLDWRGLLTDCLPLVDVFGPSIGELAYMLGADPSGSYDLPRLRRLGRQLIEMGTAVAMIKLGASGLYMRTSADIARIDAFCDRLGLRALDWTDVELLCPCFVPRTVAGTTGSGDATIAGFLAALLRGADPAAAATAATAVGACSVEALDPTSAIPSWSAIEERIAAGWERSEVGIALS